MPLIPADRDERRPIGFALLGYGFMGKAHSNALRTIPYVFWPSTARPELVAIAGRTEKGVREAATRYGYHAYTTDWREMLAEDRVAVFDNVATEDAHVEPTLAAIAAGKHVVCEKPLALDADDARRLYDAAVAAGVKHLVCFNYRFFPAVRLAWELITGGELGELHQARFRYSQEWRNAPPEAVLPSTTGVLGIIGCHAIDQARFLCGEISAVRAAVASPVTGSRASGGLQGEGDVFAAVAETTGGVLLTIDGSLVSPGRRNHLAWEVNGSRGSVAWDLENPNVLRVFHAEHGRTAGFSDVIACEPNHPLVRPWWPSGHVLGWEHGHVNMLAHLTEAVASGTPVEPYGATFLDGLRAAQVTEAITESAADRTRVTVEASPDPRPAARTPDPQSCA